MEHLGTTISVMSEWSEQLVSRFAARLRERRTDLRLSAQDLADRTEKLGHPVSRTAIADFELGRRKDRLMLGDALALAEALRMPFAALLYPHMPDGEVEVLPGVTTTSLSATQALIGLANAYVKTDHDDDDEGQRRREYMSGTGLYPLSIQIELMREELAEVRSLLQVDEVRSDLEVFGKALKKIEEIEAGIREKAEIVRLMGGVVHDG